MSESLRETFREEAQELLGELEAALLDLENDTGDPETVGRIFRSLHTLKGSGALAGLDDLAAFVHELETLFEKVRQGELEVSRSLIDLALEGRDLIRLLASGEELGPQAAAERERLLGALAKLAFGAGGSAGGGEAVYRIRFRPPPDIFLRGLDPTGLLRELERLGRCRVIAQVDAIPELETLDPETCSLYWDVLLTTGAGENAIRDVFIFVEDDSDLRIEKIAADGDLAEPDELLRLGEILVERGDLPPEELTAVLQRRPRLGEALVAERLVSGGQVAAALAEQSELRQRRRREEQEARSAIRVRSDKLDSLVNLIGELVTVQARLSQTVAGLEHPHLETIAEEVERLTWDLREQVLNIRMLPIGITFRPFQRQVRDLAAELGKDVELVAAGADTELDKTVIDRLQDPLVHLLRNCIDHGIEPPVERRALGKPDKGVIRFTAQHSGPHVVVRVSDDGRGLDLKRIHQQAVARGLLAEEDRPEEQELVALIFQSGFSTRSEVTSLSGRGVGLDAVARAIEALRGNVTVTSRSGEGTEFRIQLPLTLAIIDGLLVRLGRENYILPLADVEECVELTRQEEARGKGRNLIHLRGEIIPYIRLRERFGIRGERPPIEQVAIANLDGRRLGFVIDQVVGEHQTVIKPLGRVYREVRGLSGATVMGDGGLALILDLPQLVRLEEETVGRACA